MTEQGPNDPAATARLGPNTLRPVVSRTSNVETLMESSEQTTATFGPLGK